MEPSTNSLETGPPPGPLHLTLPDWSDLDTLRQDELPFVLWPVGSQPLLFHWLDHAHDLRRRKLVLHSADRPERVRAAIRDATLWPLEIELIPVANESEGKGQGVRGLPGSFPHRINGHAAPGSGWDLIDYWFALERDWHDYQSAHADRNVSHENVGTSCVIDPTAFIREPAQIGSHVFIGPGCKIGPYASIGDGCLIEGHSTVENARLAPDTFLSAHTELKQAYLEPEKLFNLTHRAIIEPLDAIVSTGGKPNHAQPKSTRLPFWKSRRPVRSEHVPPNPFLNSTGPDQPAKLNT